MYQPSFAKFKTATLISRVGNIPAVICGVEEQIAEMGDEVANRPGGLRAYLDCLTRDLDLIKAELARREAVS